MKNIAGRTVDEVRSWLADKYGDYTDPKRIDDVVKSIISEIYEWRFNIITHNPVSDKSLVETQIKTFYKYLDLKEPKSIVWVGSTMQGVTGILLKLKPEQSEKIIEATKDYPFLRDKAIELSKKFDYQIKDNHIAKIMDKMAVVRDAMPSIKSTSGGNNLLSMVSSANPPFDRINTMMEGIVTDFEEKVLKGNPPMCIEHRLYVPGEVCNPDLELFYETVVALHELGIMKDVPKEISLISDTIIPIMRGCTGWWPFTDFVLVCELPISVSFKKVENRYLLDADGKPAIEFSDGFGIWMINDTKVPREIAETPADKLDPSMLVKIRNAEVRKVFAEKVGMEKIITALKSKLIDREEITTGDGNKHIYELLDLELGDNRRRPYLKMINPSTNSFHVEGVPPDTKTVKDALKWRNNGLNSIPLTLN